ncbi:MAG TPA: copper homeostasis protein CutC [Flavitalea sp.]|nr:copper homeostasis protein CutC [Flavitalea sp.]
MLEVCAFNIQSAIVAERVGAKRVELCDNPVEGGTTPSYGSIRETRDNIKIHLYPIIRPRAGNYWYDKHEFAIMKRDIELCKELQCEGISVGIQNEDGTIDTERFKRIVEWAYPMGVTCNRVFDAAPDPYKALEEIIELGCERVLTSGQRSGAPLGMALLKELVEQGAGRIIIMPGAGVRANNVLELKQQTGATEFHTSARMVIPNRVSHQNPEILDIGDELISNEEELRKIVELVG